MSTRGGAGRIRVVQPSRHRPTPALLGALLLAPSSERQALAPPFSEAAEFVSQHKRAPPPNVNRCSFVGATNCQIEWDEWVMVRALLGPQHTVIEFGARYGTTSCVLASATGNRNQVISVEPDGAVLGHLLLNRHNHSCGVHVWSGTVSDVQLVMWPTRTASSRYRPDYEMDSQPWQLGGFQGREPAHNARVEQLEDATGLKVNAALIDCEGCIDHLWSLGLFERLELLLMEEDGPNAGNKSAALLDHAKATHSRLRALGFERVWRSADTQTVGGWLEHSAWRRRTAAAQADETRARAHQDADASMYMHAIARGHTGGSHATGYAKRAPRSECEEYASRMGYSERLLHCLPV